MGLGPFPAMSLAAARAAAARLAVRDGKEAQARRRQKTSLAAAVRTKGAGGAVRRPDEQWRHEGAAFRPLQMLAERITTLVRPSATALALKQIRSSSRRQGRIFRSA